MTAASGRPYQVAAIIVTYRPQAKSLRQLISTLQNEFCLVVIADNGGGREALEQEFFNDDIRLVDLEGNKGIGAALSAGLAEAAKAGVSYVISFDQDSTPLPGMVAILVNAFEQCRLAGENIGAVGPQVVDPRQSPPLLHPFVRLGLLGSAHRFCACSEETVRADLLISSGCLTSLEVIRQVGMPDPSLFIDYTDIEWCFRARSKNYTLRGICAAKMAHEIGHGEVRQLLGVSLIEYSAVRRYYYARNTCVLVGLRYVSVRWKLRLLIGLTWRLATLRWAPRPDKDSFLLERRLMLRGIGDAIRGIRGPLTG